MSIALTAPGLIRNRDLFFHDGAHLRRVRLSVPVQAVFALILTALVGWSSYATARLVTASPVDRVTASGVRRPGYAIAEAL